MAHNIRSNKTETTQSEHLPIAAHIFEGYLYLRDENTNKWLWRLFRFDGLCLTCLSSKKYKLPPHTLLDAPTVSTAANNDRQHLSFLTQNTSTTSLTSPLYATAKDKSARIANTTSNRNDPSSAPVASYYQLPKWTVQMINVSSISILKPNQLQSTTPTRAKSLKHTLLPISNISNSLYYHSGSANNKSKCFSIRTYDGKCYVLRAHKQRDFERWVFVLAKMWKFAQAGRHMYNSNEPTTPVSPTPPQFHPSASSDPHLSPTAKLANTLNESAQSFPLALDDIIVVPETKDDHFYTAKSDISHFIQKNSSCSSSSSDEEDLREAYRKQKTLSKEKKLWIEAWVNSLAALEARRPEELDYLTELNSPVSTHRTVDRPKRTTSAPQTARKSSLRYHAAHQRSHSIRQRSDSIKRKYITPVQPSTAVPTTPPLGQHEFLAHPPSSNVLKSLKLKSNNSNKRKSLFRSASAADVLTDGANNDGYIHFFQDANTVHTDESTTNAGGTSISTASNACQNKPKSNSNNSIQVKPLSKREASKHSLRYHNSFRAHPVKVVRNSTSTHHILTAPTIPVQSLQNHLNQAQHHQIHSPLEKLKKTVHYTYDSPTSNNDGSQQKDEDYDENICLEDIRKSLQSVDLSSRNYMITGAFSPQQLNVMSSPPSIRMVNGRARPRSTFIDMRNTSSTFSKQPKDKCRNSWTATINRPHPLSHGYETTTTTFT